MKANIKLNSIKELINSIDYFEKEILMKICPMKKKIMKQKKFQYKFGYTQFTI